MAQAQAQQTATEEQDQAGKISRKDRDAGDQPSENAPSSTLDAVRVSAARETPVGSASTRLPITARETPQSVSTISREIIEERNLSSLDGVLRITPGVMTALFDTQRPLYYVRGFLIEDFQLDGLPSYSEETSKEFDTAFYERIDVVRGANGILTGVGVPSATVNMIRKRPGREFGGSVQGTVGRWDFYRLEADLNAPITADGSVRSRFMVAPQKQHSFYDRYSKEQLALMAIVEADLGDATTVSAGYQRQNNKPKAPVWGSIPLLATDGSTIDLPVSTSFSPEWTFWNRNISTAFVELSHQLNHDWRLKASYSRTSGSTDTLGTYAWSTSGAPIIDRTTGSGVTVYSWRSRGRATQDSLDAYATGTLHLGGREHDLTFGISTNYSKDRSDDFTAVGNGRTYVIPNVFAWQGDMPGAQYLATGAHDDTITQQAGLYASARWKLGNQLAVLTGARLSQWSTRQKAYDADGNHTGTSARMKIDNEFTPYLGVVYDLRPDVALYASHARIFNPQNRRDRNNQVLDPAVGSNSEIGIKARLRPELNLNFALYQTKQDNFAVVDSGVAPNSLPDGSSAYVGMDGTKAKGFEVSVDGKLQPNLSLLAGVTYVNSTRNESDLLWANFPEWLLQASVDYRFKGELSPLSMGADLNWQSKIEAFNISAPGGSTTTLTDKARALIGLHATWRFNEDYSLTAAVSNLTNKRYWANLDYANYGEPRRMSLSFKAKF